MSTYRWYYGQKVYQSLEELRGVNTKSGGRDQSPPHEGTIATVINPGWNCPVGQVEGNPDDNDGCENRFLIQVRRGTWDSVIFDCSSGGVLVVQPVMTSPECHRLNLFGPVGNNPQEACEGPLPPTPGFFVFMEEWNQSSTVRIYSEGPGQPCTTENWDMNNTGIYVLCLNNEELAFWNPQPIGQLPAPVVDVKTRQSVEEISRNPEPRDPTSVAELLAYELARVEQSITDGLAAQSDNAKLIDELNKAGGDTSELEAEGQRLKDRYEADLVWRDVLRTVAKNGCVEYPCEKLAELGLGGPGVSRSSSVKGVDPSILLDITDESEYYTKRDELFEVVWDEYSKGNLTNPTPWDVVEAVYNKIQEKLGLSNYQAQARLTLQYKDLFVTWICADFQLKAGCEPAENDCGRIDVLIDDTRSVLRQIQTELADAEKRGEKSKDGNISLIEQLTTEKEKNEALLKELIRLKGECDDGSVAIKRSGEEERDNPCGTQSVILPWIIPENIDAGPNDPEYWSEPYGWRVNPDLPGRPSGYNSLSPGIDSFTGGGGAYARGAVYTFTSENNGPNAHDYTDDETGENIPLPESAGSRYLEMVDPVTAPFDLRYAYIHGKYGSLLPSDFDGDGERDDYFDPNLDKPEASQDEDLELEITLDPESEEPTWIRVLTHEAIARNDGDLRAINWWREQVDENLPWRTEHVQIGGDIIVDGEVVATIEDGQPVGVRFIQRNFLRTRADQDEWAIDDVVICKDLGDCNDPCGPGGGIGTFVWLPTVYIEDVIKELTYYEGGHFDALHEEFSGLGRYMVKPNDRIGGTQISGGDPGRWVSVIPHTLWKNGAWGIERVRTHIISHQDALIACDGPGISRVVDQNQNTEVIFKTDDGYGGLLLLKPTNRIDDGYGLMGGKWSPKLNNPGDECHIFINGTIHTWNEPKGIPEAGFRIKVYCGTNLEDIEDAGDGAVIGNSELLCAFEVDMSDIPAGFPGVGSGIEFGTNIKLKAIADYDCLAGNNEFGSSQCSVGWSSKASSCVGSSFILGTKLTDGMPRIGPAFNEEQGGHKWLCLNESVHLVNWFSSKQETGCGRSLFATLEWGNGNSNWNPDNESDQVAVSLNHFDMTVYPSTCAPQLLGSEVCMPEELECNFSANPTGGYAPLLVQFTDETIGAEIVSYDWSFGDGGGSNERNPLYMYTSPGEYTVTLTVVAESGESCSVTRDNYVFAADGSPVAENGEYTITWGSGAGAGSIDQFLQIADPNSTDESIFISIHGQNDPSLGAVCILEGGPGSNCSGLSGNPPALFRYEASLPAGNRPYTQDWFDFTATDEQGNTATARITINIPEVIYGCTDPGACDGYNPSATHDDGSCLYLDDCGVCGGPGKIECWNGCLVCDPNSCPPEPGIGSDVTSGETPLDVEFVYTGDDHGGVQSYQIDFGDGNTETGTALPTGSTISHTYDVPGVYTAKLEVSGGFEDCGDTNSDEIVIVVSQGNTAPIANDMSVTVTEGELIDITLDASDNEQTQFQLTPTIVSAPTHGVVGEGSPGTPLWVQYTHDGSETSSDSFTYRVSDGTLSSNIATVSITIIPVNDGPDLASIPDVIMHTGETRTFNLLVTDVDTPLGDMSYTHNGPSWMSIDDTSVPATVTLSQPPDPMNPFSVTITVDDGGATDSESFNINVIQEESSEFCLGLVGDESSNTVTVNYYSTKAIAGFQFDVVGTGGIFPPVTALAEGMDGFIIQVADTPPHTILGFSMSGGVISATHSPTDDCDDPIVNECCRPFLKVACEGFDPGQDLKLENIQIQFEDGTTVGGGEDLLCCGAMINPVVANIGDTDGIPPDPVIVTEDPANEDTPEGIVTIGNDSGNTDPLGANENDAFDGYVGTDEDGMDNPVEGIVINSLDGISGTVSNDD